MLRAEDRVAIEGETALQLFARVNRASDTLGPLGVPLLDNLLPREGLAPGAVVELSGPPASCKSQLLYDIACGCIAPQRWNDIEIGGANVSVVFIDLDCRFSIIRLVAMLEARLKSRAAACGRTLDDEGLQRFVRECLDRLYHVRCQSNLNLLATVISLDAFLQTVKSTPVRALLVDNLTSFFWEDRAEAQGNFRQQYAFQSKICAAIKNLAADHRLVVFATRAQLFASSGKPAGGGEAAAERAPGHDPTSKEWQAMVTYRLTLERADPRITQRLARQTAATVREGNSEVFVARAAAAGSGSATGANASTAVQVHFRVGEAGIEML